MSSFLCRLSKLGSLFSSGQEARKARQPEDRPCPESSAAEAEPPPSPPRRLYIFDLDQTMGAVVPIQGLGSGARGNCCLVSHMVQQFYFVFRPHAQGYVERAIAEGADVAVWSAGAADYVDTVLGMMFGEGFPWLFVWTAAQCEGDSKVKDLRWVAKTFPEYEGRVTLFDDSQLQVSINRGRGFRCVEVPPFDPGEADDFFLFCDAEARGTAGAFCGLVDQFDAAELSSRPAPLRDASPRKLPGPVEAAAECGAEPPRLLSLPCSTELYEELSLEAAV